MGVELGQFGRCEVVVRATVDHARQAGVRQHADRHRRVLRQIAQVLLHLGRAGRAVDAEHVGAHGADRSDGGADLAADQHASGGLHGDLDLDWDFPSFGGHGPSAGDHRRFDLQEIHAGLDEEEVGATDDQPASLFFVGVAQFGERDVSEAREFGAGADRTGHVARTAVGLVVVRRLAGEAGRGDVEFVRPLGNVVFGEDGGEASEAGRLDGVDADVEERRMHVANDVGT